ncbi:MAG: hypothetical protein HY513_02775 [Candidatus Aenigmarchaeota archaeon]|nr:hypothetical protein [Candidatus Aenigmarchaeota archaeon]
MKKVILILSVIVLVMISGCTSTNTDTNNQNYKNDKTVATQPDSIQNITFKGCPSLIKETELEAATSWKAVDTQMFTGSYGSNEIDCNYYESIGAFKYHVSYNLFSGGNEKLDSLAASYKNRFPTREYSDGLVLGVKSFSNKPNLLAFVDKETGIVVWMQLDADNLQLTEADWNNLIAIGRAIDAKLN